jgi:hypothetical protein
MTNTLISIFRHGKGKLLQQLVEILGSIVHFCKTEIIWELSLTRLATQLWMNNLTSVHLMLNWRQLKKQKESLSKKISLTSLRYSKRINSMQILKSLPSSVRRRLKRLSTTQLKHTLA